MEARSDDNVSGGQSGNLSLEIPRLIPQLRGVLSVALTGHFEPNVIGIAKETATRDRDQPSNILRQFPLHGVNYRQM